MARARAIRDELSNLVAGAMAKAVKRPLSDPMASLGASLVVATWATALVQAHRTFHATQDTAKAYKSFLAIIDRGSSGAAAAVQGTRYA